MRTIALFYITLLMTLSSQSGYCQGLKPTSYWTHFRGSDLTALAIAENLPAEWDDQKNVIWKTAIHGKGWSSPVVYNNQVWISTADTYGNALYAVCVDFSSGDIIHNIKLYEPDSLWSIHAVNSYATPTPCIDGNRVYFHFGQYGTSCLNTKTGEKVWERTDLFCDHVQGPGSSPIIHNNMLILHMEGVDVQYIIAFDKETGETLWRTDRPADLMEHLGPIGRKAYITPIVMKVGERELLISNGSAVCIAYDVNTGEEVWRVVQGEDSTISMPVVWGGTVFFYTGFYTKADESKTAELLAVDPTGFGDVTNTHVLWRMETPILQLLTPLVKDGLLYTVDTRGNMQCIDAQTGSMVWEERVHGKFNASPVYADGKLFFPSTTGKVVVIAEGKSFQLLAENQLDGEIWASPAIVDQSIIIRTNKSLYRIGNQ